jgi:hypothetical protein
MLRHVAFVRTDVSKELSASIIRVTRIGELRTLAVTKNRRNTTANVVLSSPIFVTLMMEARPPLWSSGQSSWLLTQRSGFDFRRYQIF